MRIRSFRFIVHLLSFLVVSGLDHVIQQLHDHLALFLDVLRQRHLVARADEVVVGRANLEVQVAVDVVGEEAHGQLAGDDVHGAGHELDLLRREDVLHLAQEAAGEQLEQVEVEGHLAEIGLILCGGGCASG